MNSDIEKRFNEFLQATCRKMFAFYELPEPEHFSNYSTEELSNLIPSLLDGVDSERMQQKLEQMPEKERYVFLTELNVICKILAGQSFL